MQVSILMVEMLLTHEVENISRTVKHCNRKVASEVVTGIVTTENFMFRKSKNDDLLLLHRMMSHSIWLNCLVIVIEFLGASNSKIIVYGDVHVEL
jgi:hypothetical protein